MFTCGTSAGRVNTKPSRPQRMLANSTHLRCLPGVYHANQNVVHFEADSFKVDCFVTGLLKMVGQLDRLLY